MERMCAMIRSLLHCTVASVLCYWCLLREVHIGPWRWLFYIVSSKVSLTPPTFVSKILVDSKNENISLGSLICRFMETVLLNVSIARWLVVLKNLTLALFRSQSGTIWCSGRKKIPRLPDHPTWLVLSFFLWRYVGYQDKTKHFRNDLVVGRGFARKNWSWDLTSKTKY